jgi:sRNA-binding protein
MPAQKTSLPQPLVVVRKKRLVVGASVTTSPRSGVAKPRQPPALLKKPPLPLPPVPAPSLLSPPSAAVSQPPPDEQEIRQRKTQEKYELLAILRDRWPQTFPTDFQLVKPFAKGVHKELQKALPEVKPILLRRTIHFYQRGGKGAYWRAILKGGPRYTLDGTPQGEVTAEEQEHAKQELAAVAAWWKARRAGQPHRAPPQDEPPYRETPRSKEEEERHKRGGDRSERARERR